MGLLRSILEWEIDFKTKNFVYRKDILISFRLFDRKLSSELVGGGSVRVLWYGVTFPQNLLTYAFMNSVILSQLVFSAFAGAR